LPALLITAWQLPGRAEDAVKLPPPGDESSNVAGDGLVKVVLAGGCFWGVQAVFQHVKGVTSAVSGYAGGTGATAHYEIVSSGRTGHAEAVEVEFDPHQVSYGKILQVYFSVAHDPTQLNRQGPDFGPQYRSAIFFANEAQKRIAENYMGELGAAHVFKRPIVTKLEPLSAFYPAEAYHQNYATIHPNQPYILYNDRPKVEHLEALFAELYREQPVLVAAAQQEAH
jgi:peptide-methionine (S)-S-oxide reductase